jgi:hypothetical protein
VAVVGAVGDELGDELVLDAELGPETGGASGLWLADGDEPAPGLPAIFNCSRRTGT